MELRIDLLAQSHDIASTGGNVKEQINRALDANQIWEEEIVDTVARLGKATTEEVSRSAQNALDLNWSGDLGPVAAALTTQAYLKALCQRGLLRKSEAQEKGKILWTAP